MLKTMGEIAREAAISWGVHRVTSGSHKASHSSESEGGQKPKEKPVESKKGEGGEKPRAEEHATHAPKTAAGAVGADLAKWIDKLLVDNRKILFHVLRSTPEFDKRNVLARLDEATAGKASMSENKLVDCLLKAVTVYDGDDEKARRDGPKVIRHLNDLSPEAFWREMELLHHNPIEQMLDRTGNEVAEVLKEQSQKLRSNRLLDWILKGRK